MKGRALLFSLGMLAGPLQAAERIESWQRIQVPVECSQREAESTCLLQLPDRKLRDLVLEVPAGNQVVGFRLYKGWRGLWRLEASGFWHPAPESRHRIRTVNTLYGGPVRLELVGEKRPPQLAGATVDAEEPEPAAAKDLGPAPKASRAVFALEDVWFPAAWPVRADGARPGDMVRLELPNEVLARLGLYERFGLRVATPEGQLPWELEIDEMPRAEVEMAEARWVPAGRPGWLRLSFPDLPQGPAYTEIQLFAPPQPLVRRVLVAEAERLWTCVPEPPLPCRLALDFSLNGLPRRLPEIEIEGGEDNPLPPVRVSVWRRIEHLVFVWPGQGPVRLFAGSDRASGSGMVSLLEIDPPARDRPWKRALLGPEERLPLARQWQIGGAAFATLVLASLCVKEWRRRRLVAALLLSLAAAPAWGEDVFLERTLGAPAAGWVRVPLDLETLARLGPEQRWLWVIGPDGTELPAGVWLETELPSDPSRKLPEDWPEIRTWSSRLACERTGTTTSCLLRLPVAGQVPRELRVAVAGGEPGEEAGLRLSTAREGRWEILAEGVWETSFDRRWRLPLEAEPLESPVLRLELVGLRGPQRPVRVELDLVPASLVFEAAEPGAYRLMIGAGRGPEKGRQPAPWNDRLSTLEPGPVHERPLPPLPRETVAPRTLGDFETAAEWPVRAPGAVAGGVVRLELPVDVYLRAGSLDRLRLETAGRQIPYVLRSLDLPAPVARGMISPGGDKTVSFAVAPSLLLTAWNLETKGPVSTAFTSDLWSLGTRTGNGMWTCDPHPLLPCVVEVEYQRRSASRAVVIPLTVQGQVSRDINVTLWRQRHELVFVWPREGAVRLLAGAEGIAAPTYDLHAVADQLLARSWKPAVLEPGVEHSAPGSQKTRKALLGAAALVLLAAVHRLMPRSPSPPPAGLR